jgi:hypothetical protein
MFISWDKCESMDKPHVTPATVRRITERVMMRLESNPVWSTPVERTVHAAIAKTIIESCGEEGCDEDWLCHLAMERVYCGGVFIKPVGRPLIESS